MVIPNPEALGLGMTSCARAWELLGGFANGRKASENNLDAET